ncbi:MAG TPA: methylmalonyl Co-A mutase-associated GTPase MeaB [Clostridiales bacterium]|nr:methylmalonyl Co-A mutase-associated GTPase MeaB [Clostridiales bacterium]
MELVERLLDGDRRALARAITLTENEDPRAAELARAVFPHTGRARTLGVTGPPGAGKSTLVDGLTHLYRRSGRRVGVVAVDPTSPFTGGAILGDRIRMRRGAADPDVFIRSLATRGHLGGLSWHTGSVVRLLDAAGFDTVIIETVGAGQAEVEVMRYAETTIVVMVPGLGDEVQAIKAGILEIADVIAVNKADREGADSLVRELEMMLELGGRSRGGRSGEAWTVPVVKTVATTDEGMEDLFAAAERHREHLAATGELEAWQTRELAAEVTGLIRDLVGQKAQAWAETAGAWEETLAQVAARRMDPRTAADTLVAEFLACARSGSAEAAGGGPAGEISGGSGR